MNLIYADEVTQITDDQIVYMCGMLKKRPFTLGILGYNSQLSVYGLRQFAKNNQEQVKYFDKIKNEVILNDGTIVKALKYTDICNRELQGHYLDQLILFDDDRWLIEFYKWEEINELLTYMKHRSGVPEEFRILKYDDVRGD